MHLARSCQVHVKEVTIMPQLFAIEVSPDVYEANKHLLVQPKAPKTKARQEIDAELRQQFARQFEATWKLLGGPELETEHYFHPTRQWHSDYLHRPTMTLIELEGGVHSKGRHVRPGGFIEDCFKYNTATLMGYRVIRIATGMATPSYIETIITYLQQK
jgi:hypothetical protein